MKRMARYSASQIQTYLQCPLKYRYRYIDRVQSPEFVETIDTLLGLIVHESLQNLYGKINVFKVPLKDEVIGDYYNLWSKKEKDIKDNGGEILNYHSDLVIDDFKRRGEIYISRYYDMYYPFKDLQVIGIEKQISFQLDEGINFLGFIDRLDKDGDTFVINDYKTTKNLPSDDEKDQYIEQLTLYGLGIHQKYNKFYKNLKARLYFLHFDIEYEWDLTQEKLCEVRDKYLKIIEEIERNKVQYFMGSRKVFESRQSSFCGWCDYQSICPLFSVINKNNDFEGELSDKNIAVLVDKFVDITDKISNLEKEKELLKGTFQKYLMKKDPNDEKSDFLLSGIVHDLKITKVQNFDVVDKDKFLKKIKKLGLFEEYADIPLQTLNKLFLKSGKIKISDFVGMVEERLILVLEKQNKK